MLVLLRGFCLGLAGSVAVFIGASGVKAQAVGLTEKMAEARIALDGREIVIARNQDDHWRFFQDVKSLPAVLLAADRAGFGG